MWLPWQKRHGALELAHAPFHLLEALHHLLELRVMLQQPVDVGDLGAAALGDPRATAPSQLFDQWLTGAVEESEPLRAGKLAAWAHQRFPNIALELAG